MGRSQGPSTRYSRPPTPGTPVKLQSATGSSSVRGVTTGPSVGRDPRGRRSRYQRRRRSLSPICSGHTPNSGRDYTDCDPVPATFAGGRFASPKVVQIVVVRKNPNDLGSAYKQNKGAYVAEFIRRVADVLAQGWHGYESALARTADDCLRPCAGRCSVPRSVPVPSSGHASLNGIPIAVATITRNTSAECAARWDRRKFRSAGRGPHPRERGHRNDRPAMHNRCTQTKGAVMSRAQILQFS